MANGICCPRTRGTLADLSADDAVGHFVKLSNWTIHSPPLDERMAKPAEPLREKGRRPVRCHKKTVDFVTRLKPWTIDGFDRFFTIFPESAESDVSYPLRSEFN